jgi:adenylate cyclase
VTSRFLEIERKFLVAQSAWPTPLSSSQIRQAYLTRQPGLSVRVRQRDDDWLLTIKATLNDRMRQEYEVPIAAEMGAAMMRDTCVRPPIEKQRLIVMDGTQRWEIDLFQGVNAGLRLAEAELAAADQALTIPAWVGPEVTHDQRFTNQAIYHHPFSQWGVTYADLLTQMSAAGQALA